MKFAQRPCFATRRNWKSTSPRRLCEMRILDVPDEFRPPRSHNGRHDHHYGVAEAFYKHVISPGVAVETDAIYIPVFWAACYHSYAESRGDPVFRALPHLQEFLVEALDPNEQYFTVMRCDEGCYEELPKNVLVFGACGGADVQIPLTSDILPEPPGLEPEYLASFAGFKRPGGPVPHEGHVSFSDWIPEGVGTRVRSKMFAAFEGRGDCLLRDCSDLSEQGWRYFSDLMRKTKYALAPRGYGATSFRLYEAMALGAVPVYISDRFLLPYAERLNWDDFCIYCSEDQIDGLPERLEATPEEWREGAVRQLRELYPKYFSLDGTCRQIVRCLEAL